MDACGGCGAGLQPGDRFCAACGRPATGTGPGDPRGRATPPGLGGAAFAEPGGRPALAGPPAGAVVPPYGWSPQPAFHPSGPPGPATPVAPHRPTATPPAATNQMAIASLVIALVGLPLCLLSPVAIPFGHVALGQIRRSAGGPPAPHPPPQPGAPRPAVVLQGGRGLAIAGLVIGYVVLALWVIVLAQFASAGG